MIFQTKKTYIKRPYRNSIVGGVATGQLDGGLVGFRSAVAEECLVGSGIIAQPLGQCGLRWHVVQIGNVVDLIDLPRDGIGQFLVAVSQTAGGNATDKIQVFLPLVGRQSAPLSTFKRQWEASAKNK